VVASLIVLPQILRLYRIPPAGDPQLPVALWGLSTRQTGDGAAGSAQVVISPTLAQIDPYITSLEFVQLRMGDGISRALEVVVNTQEQLGVTGNPGLAAIRLYGQANSIVGGVSNNLATVSVKGYSGQLSYGIPFFAWRHFQIAWTITLDVPNVAAVTYDFTAVGYYWDRALLDRGLPPRRPNDW